MEQLELIYYLAAAAIMGALVTYTIPKMIRLLSRKSFVEEKADVRCFKRFADPTIRFAYHFYDRQTSSWENRAKALSGFSALLLTAVVAITAQYFSSDLFAKSMTVASAVCFLLATLISSFYIVFPRGALWKEPEEAIAYKHNKAITLEKVVGIAFVFFMVGNAFNFLTLLSIASM